MTDPWGDTVSSPENGDINPWVSPAPAESPSTQTRRASWRPNTAAVVITTCGHIELEWEIVRVLGGKFVKHVYCEICGEWMRYKRASARDIITARNAAGIDSLF